MTLGAKVNPWTKALCLIVNNWKCLVSLDQGFPGPELIVQWDCGGANRKCKAGSDASVPAQGGVDVMCKLISN